MRRTLNAKPLIIDTHLYHTRNDATTASPVLLLPKLRFIPPSFCYCCCCICSSPLPLPPLQPCLTPLSPWRSSTTCAAPAWTPT